MDILTLQQTIIDALEDIKAQDILVFDTKHLTQMFDRIIIASGTSNRQTRGLAISVRNSVKAAGGCVISTEGLETGEWILVDCGDIVVHVMQPIIREYYKLEQMWGDKPVAVTLGQVKSTALKNEKRLSEGETTVDFADDVESAFAVTPEVTKATVKKTAAQKVAAKKTAAKKVATNKVAAKKVPAKKIVVKKTLAKTAGSERAAVKKVAAKKVATKKGGTETVRTKSTVAIKKSPVAKKTTVAKKVTAISRKTPSKA